MPYNYLAPPLRPIADMVVKHLKEKLGLKKILLEKIDFDASPAPTITGNSIHGIRVCVEVNSSLFPVTLDSFVADCIQQGLPIKLYVAIAKPEDNSLNLTDLRRAKKFGIGSILVDESNKVITILNEPLELSLLLDDSSRDLSRFPHKFRSDITTAINTYQNGDPKKGISDICELAEDICRKVAKAAKKKGVIPSSNTIDLDKGDWSGILKLMTKHSVLHDIILADWLGKTRIRNSTNHPSKDFNERAKLHRRFKTNFNSCLDSLKDLFDECLNKSYRI